MSSRSDLASRRSTKGSIRAYAFGTITTLPYDVSGG